MTDLNEDETHSLCVQLCSARGPLAWLLRAPLVFCASDFYVKYVQSASQNLLLAYFWNHRIKMDFLSPLCHL